MEHALVLPGACSDPRFAVCSPFRVDRNIYAGTRAHTDAGVQAPCHQIVVRLQQDSFEPAVTCTNPGRLRLVIENRTEQAQDVGLSGPGLFQRLPLIEAGRSRIWETTLPGGSYVVAERLPPEGAQPRSAIVILKLDCSAPL
jgi:hypothetical protein